MLLGEESAHKATLGNLDRSCGKERAEPEDRGLTSREIFWGLSRRSGRGPCAPGSRRKGAPCAVREVAFRQAQGGGCAAKREGSSGNQPRDAGGSRDSLLFGLSREAQDRGSAVLLQFGALLPESTFSEALSSPSGLEAPRPRSGPRTPQAMTAVRSLPFGLPLTGRAHRALGGGLSWLHCGFNDFDSEKLKPPARRATLGNPNRSGEKERTEFGIAFHSSTNDSGAAFAFPAQEAEVRVLQVWTAARGRPKPAFAR